MNPEHLAPQILLRAWPLPRGAGRIIDKFFSKLQFRDSPAIVKTSDGFEIAVDPNELVGRHLYLSGEFDRSIVEVICNFSERGDTLLDIGANIGYVSGCFLQNVQDSKVIAVEPQSTVLELLTRNLTGPAVTIYPYALGDKDGEAWFRTYQENNGAGRIVSEAGQNTIRVQTRSAETMFRELGIKRIDLVKIDAEGFEKTIVAACLKQFERLQPRIILFEDDARDAREIAGWLDKIGYRTFAIKKSLAFLSLIELSSTSHNYGNYVAVSKNRRISDRAKRQYRIVD